MCKYVISCVNPNLPYFSFMLLPFVKICLFSLLLIISSIKITLTYYSFLLLNNRRYSVPLKMADSGSKMFEINI